MLWHSSNHWTVTQILGMEYCPWNISAYISIFKDKYGCQCTTPATHVHQPILQVASVFAQHCAPFHSPTFQSVFTPSLSQHRQKSPRYQRSHRTPKTKTFKAHLRGGDQTTRALRTAIPMTDPNGAARKMVTWIPSIYPKC